MQFRGVEGTVRYFQLSGQSIPGHFLETLHLVMVFSEEHNLLVGGDTLADSFDSAVNLCVRHSCSLIDLLHQAMRITSGSPIFVSGSGGNCQLDEVGSLGVQSSGSCCFPPPSSSFSPRFASSGPSSSLPLSSRLPLPVPSPFFALLVSSLASFPSALPQSFTSLPHPFATFAPPLPSLSSPVRSLARFFGLFFRSLCFT